MRKAGQQFRRHQGDQPRRKPKQRGWRGLQDPAIQQAELSEVTQGRDMTLRSLTLNFHHQRRDPSFSLQLPVPRNAKITQRLLWSLPSKPIQGCQAKHQMINSSSQAPPTRGPPCPVSSISTTSAQGLRTVRSAAKQMAVPPSCKKKKFSEQHLVPSRTREEKRSCWRPSKSKWGSGEIQLD